MNPFGIISYIKMIESFWDSSKTFISEDKELIDYLSGSNRNEVVKTNKLLLTFVITGLLIPILFIPLVAPIINWMIVGAALKDILFRSFCILILSPGTAFLGIYFGISVALLFMPKWYLMSPFGDKWIALVGCDSKTGRIFVCSLVIITSVIIFGFLFWIPWIVKPL